MDSGSTLAVIAISWLAMASHVSPLWVDVDRGAGCTSMIGPVGSACAYGGRGAPAPMNFVPFEQG